MGVEPEQIRQSLRSQPFEPFVIRLADGRAFVVRHPELAMLTPSGRTVYVAVEGERVERIDALLVTSLSAADERG